jgi:large subunit ribosomal protein L18e
MKNEQLQALIGNLKKASAENDSKIWKSIAFDLEKPTKKRAVVNLSKIDRYSENDDVIVVPGKVLSMGTLTKKITIAAYNYSSDALDKIKESGSKAVTIEELAKKNPKGNKVKIIG